jgi:methanogenic corrinoid protein MtbC1
MNELYRQLSKAVVAMNAEEAKKLAQRVLEEGLPPDEAIEKGLAAGMNRVGELFAAKEYFVPEVLVCSRAMYAGFDILKSHVVEGKIGTKGTIAIGVVDGDFHDIGKNIVKLMLEAAGFRLIDLGKNVTSEKFLQSVLEEKPAIVALSTLMTTTMDSMEVITADLLANNPHLKIMVGGAPVNLDFARSIGAHFYGSDAREAVKGAHQLLGKPFEA